jgi:hypothetical protein
MALEFPCEHNNLVILVLQLESLNLNVMLLHSEKLKYCVCTFLCFGVTHDQPEHHNTRSYEISAAFQPAPHNSLSGERRNVDFHHSTQVEEKKSEV